MRFARSRKIFFEKKKKIGKNFQLNGGAPLPMLFLTFLENGTNDFPLERGVGEAGNLEEIGGWKPISPG